MAKDFQETVALELGPAIAKGLAKLWLAGEPIAGELATSAIDVIQRIVRDRSKHPKASRMLGEIGERVAEELRRFVEIESPQMDDGSRNAVGLAVAVAIRDADLSSQALVRANVDPSRIAELLQARRKTLVKDFSDAERSLFDASIAEVSRQLTEVASRLPLFTEKAFAEVLSRQTQLTTSIEQVLQELRRIREETVTGSATERDRFEVEYRRVASGSYDKLELIGVDLPVASQRYKLSVAYVALTVQRKILAAAQEKNDDQKGKKKSAAGSAEDNLPPPATAVELILADSPRLLLRGLAGHGKTTLLRWITVQSAARRHTGKLQAWNEKIPFFINLRHCRSGLPQPGQFVEVTVETIGGQAPKEWAFQKLQEGKAILLIDGVDEVPKGQRDAIRDWIAELTIAYPKNIFIVTTRPTAVADGWLAEWKFLEGELQPMGLPEINACIDHWHQAISAGDEKSEVQEKAAARGLQKLVGETPSLRNLATSPLLCAMLCALNRERQQQLPRDRIELYDAACALLIQRRDVERGVDLSGYPPLNLRQKLTVLKDIAYWFVKNGWSEVAVEDIDARLTERIEHIRSIDSAKFTGLDLRAYLVERSGVLREPVIGSVDFTHKTFQEFLAARQIAEERDTGLLLKNATDDQWREVVILAAGLCNPEDQEKIVRGLIKKGDEDSASKHQYHLLSVACLETATELSADTEKEVIRRLAKLIPPKSISEAKDLASARELAIPYLVNKASHKAVEAAASVRALSLIGGDAALDRLCGYAGDTRQTVINEVMKAIHSFDSYKFGEKVLANLKWKPGYLQLDRLDSIEGLSFLRGVNHLTLQGLSSVSDFSPLANVTELKKLAIRSLWGTDAIQTFGRNDSIEELELAYSGPADISAIGELRNLRRLELNAVSRVKSLDFITACKGLEHLTMMQLAIDNVTAIAKLRKLHTLDLTACQEVKTLEGLAGSDMRDLFVHSCSAIADASGIAKLSNLRLLQVTHCPGIVDLSVLGKMARLEILRLERLSLKDYSFLDELQNKSLKELWLSAVDREMHQQIGERSLGSVEVQIFYLTHAVSLTPFADRHHLAVYLPRAFRPLGALPKLVSLRVEGNRGQEIDFAEISALQSLRTLRLDNVHRFQNLAAIGQLADLRELHLGGTFHSAHLTILSKLPKLERVGLPKRYKGSALVPRGLSVEFLD